MEKLRSLISPGHRQDDELLYSQKESTSPTGPHTGRLSGEGTHLASARQQDSNPAEQKGLESQKQNVNPSDNQYTQTHTGPTTTATTTTTTAPQNSKRTHDPTQAQTGPGEYMGTDGAIGGVSDRSHLAPNTRENVSRPGQSNEDASTTSLKSGVMGYQPQEKSRDPLTGNTNKPLPGAPATGGSTTLPERSATSPNQSLSNNQPLSNIPRETRQSHPGRDAALGAGIGVLAGHEMNRHHEPNTTEERMTADHDRAFPLASGAASSNTTHQPTEARNAGLGANQGREGLATAAAPIYEHEHGGRGHEYTGDPCGPNEKPVGSPHFAQGPHATDTTNRLDPHIPGAYPALTPTEELQEPTPQHHYGRDAALAGAGAATAGGLYEANKQRQPDTGPASYTIGPHKSNLANIADPRIQPDSQLMGHHQAGPTPEDPATKTVGPHKSNIANIFDPRVKPEPEKMKGHTTTGPHNSDTLNRLDPKVDSKAQSEDQHHYGRDAALAGGAGGVGLGAYEAEKRHHSQLSGNAGAPLTNEPEYSNPYSASKLNPHVDHLSKGVQGNSRPSEHHHGRDAALAGGLGAALAGGLGAGAYEADKHHRDHETAQPVATQSMAGQQVGPKKEHHYGRDAALPGGLGAGAYVDERYCKARKAAQPAATQSMGGQQIDPTTQFAPVAHDQTHPTEHHYGRDAALAGGAGGAGLGVYEAAQKYDTHRSAQPPSAMNEQRYDPTAASAHDPAHPTQHHYGRDAALAGGAGAAGVGGYEAEKHHGHDGAHDPASYENKEPTVGHQRYDSVQDPQNQHHHHMDRDAAVVGAAGAAGAGADGAGAEHEYSKYEAGKAEKERLKEQKSHEKQIAHEQKVHQKEMEKKEKAHEKEIEREQKHHQKEIEKAKKHGEKEKKHHHLFGFLHRDKKNKHPEETTEPEDAHHHEEEYAAAGAATAGVGAAAYEDGHDKEGRNRLHKDPPAGNMPQEGLADNSRHFGADGEIGRSGMSGTGETHPGVMGGENEGRVVEPHTGLPRNVGKYGDGHDGNPAIEGFYQHAQAAQK